MDLYSLYNQRIAAFNALELVCFKKEQKLPFYRLFIVVAGVALFILFFKISLIISISAAVVFLVLFIITIRIDLVNQSKKKEFQLLKLLNENEINYLDGKFDFFDDGKNYFNENHPYANDLDIFGTTSLFQSINRTTLPISSNVLADWLLYPAEGAEIKERNEAVKELSEKIDWRQKLFVKGYALKNSGDSLINLIGWVTKESKNSIQKNFVLFCYLLTGITILTIALTFFFPISYIPTILIFVHLIIVWKMNGVVKKSHQEVTNNAQILETYSEILYQIENEQFSSVKLNKLKELLKSDQHFASKEIKKLSKIVGSFDLRYNVLAHVFLNTFLFWDIHQVYKLEKWKKTNKNIEQWFHSVGEYEALSSFSNLYFNNPDWCFPKIIDNHFLLDAKDMGHPLIVSKERVCNSIAINGAGKILLVSGSNMSGKSTFLRTVGVNFVLAMAGSSVCASEYSFSPVRILSSMRVSDSLKDNTSTFFAELKKLESIIKEVDRKEKVFFLLDEILRGTNSIDRHIGSSALIRQFILKEAVGIIATHDLALTEMAQEFPLNIENYNFNIKINNEDLYFDYLLNKGVCTSLNASILMKKMGINIP